MGFKMINLNKKSIFLGLLITGCLRFGFAQAPCPLIPLPAQCIQVEGNFRLDMHTPILVADDLLKPMAHYFQKEMLRTTGIPLSIQKKADFPGIKLIRSGKPNENDQSYEIQMGSRGITITSSSVSGTFYGLVSLLQMVRQATVLKGSVQLNCFNIRDKPAYNWRGIMLDESRHFYGKEKVKAILDWMAFYKLNRFHWHLTDEPAWRLEIKKFPRLTLVGGIGSFTDEKSPAKYYTQEEIKEIIAYAAERQIEIIPEIDMPGHATAANKAYPEFNGGGSATHPDFTFNPGKEATYTYLSKILRETNTLFPSAMLHIGGDEVSFGTEKWLADASIQQLMQDKKLKTEKDIERYFMKRMADTVYSMNAKLLGWDEMAEADLPKDKTILFWWRQDKPEQLELILKKGYQAVLCPRLPLYFDFVQDSLHRNGRKWNKFYNSIEDVYAFSADKYPFTAAASKQILGIQANLWTETTPTIQRLDFMLFPRIAALAEAAWTNKDNKNIEQFMIRLKGHLALYEQEGITYYNPFLPGQTPEAKAIKRNITYLDTVEDKLK